MGGGVVPRCSRGRGIPVSAHEVLERLSALCGIVPRYHDIWGKLHEISDDTRRALLGAMHLAVATDEEAQAALEAMESRDLRRLLPPVLVVQAGKGPIEIPLAVPAVMAQARHSWQLVLENGESHQGEFKPSDLGLLEERRIAGALFARHGFELPVAPTIGYHRLEVHGPGDGESASARMLLVVAPDRCYQPPAVQGEQRVWGPTVQLYAVRSRRNWGIGDYGDLRGLVDLAAEAGAGIVGVNPLHALFPHDPERASPYGPSSRRHFNVFYIDVEAVPDFAECDEARRAVRDPEFQARLRALRGEELVDYKGVAAVKLPVLERLHQHFREHHLAVGSERGRAFEAYRRDRDSELHGFALYHALQDHFHRNDSSVWGWPLWPEDYRNPDSPQVAAFASAQRGRVEFHEYLQWQAELQLAAAGRHSWERGLGVGIYGDLAVGIDRGGAEGWMHQDLYALGARVGAPPDDFNLHGQDWGLPPLIPHRLTEAAYEPFIGTLRSNMRHSGALRIDHVMGLMRLFWVPPGGSPADGGYVAYPFQDMLGILALESQRNRCLVIGEDLGTVPDEVRDALAPLGVLSYRPFFFERENDGAFKRPTGYPRNALVAVSTHDLPTLAGYWQGADLDLRASLGLFPSDEARHNQVVGRAQDRARLLMALEQEQLLPPDVSVHPVSNPEMTPELVRAIHVYLARAPSVVMVVQPEDVLGQTAQVNLPGSRPEQFPSWRRKLTLDLEEWGGDARFRGVTEALREVRGRSVEPRVATAYRAPVAARVPLATYRLQFHRDFTLSRATQLVPYLHALGVTHCYASPLLKARPGSTHGYDIVDHSALNPEVGTPEDFDRFTDALRERGMGLLLDFVPNHMGVLGSDNAWWLDVLENGEASVFAEFFDIDWQPIKDELQGKVLLPVLGDHYGRVLESGELKLEFDQERGEFSVRYYEHRFPVDPREYPRILGHGVERLAARLGEHNQTVLELQSVAAAFGHLPPRDATARERVAERARDKEILKRRLAAQCAGSEDLRFFIGENLATFNGVAGDPQSFDLLHQMIKAQTFRLAYWRVASDEINYRRFFDINELAGLRMEQDAVFDATHGLLFGWLSQGRIDGLRLDHPDGLYDPGSYFRKLQRHISGTTADSASDKAAYLVIEKILAEHERLPDDWPVHGTTGYRFANLVSGLFVDTSAADKMERIYASFTGIRTDFEDLLYRCKRLIIRTALASELNVLAGELSRIAQMSRHTCDFTLNSLREALAEVVACFPVYRTYVTEAGLSEQDRRFIEWAVAVAKRRSPAADVTVFDFVREILTTDISRGRPPEYARRVHAFAMKFQQYTAPVMAKGLEDTSFYRYNRLVSLNDVGGDPRTFGFSVGAFHGASQDRARTWPNTMLASSTHDSKRSEDVRARINVLSEIPAAWKLSVAKWARLNRSKKSEVDGRPAPSANDEYLLYQTLIGAWPVDTMDAAGLEAFRERIEGYMLKAVREAKEHTSWINPNPDYERALSRFVAALLGSAGKNPFLADFVTKQRVVARCGMLNSLSQTLVKLASPGVPDVYQGTEMLDFSLVDPDNRRPVDFERRAAALNDLSARAGRPGAGLAGVARSLLDSMADGRAKLYVTWRALSCRRDHAELFRAGDYLPLAVEGKRAEHLCAFARRRGGELAVAVAPRLFARLMEGGEVEPVGEVWAETRVEVPEAEYEYFNVLTGETLKAEGDGTRAWLPLDRVLANFPVALFTASGS